MITGDRTTINALIVVLFLTMMVLDFTLLNVAYFLVLFYFMWKLR